MTAVRGAPRPGLAEMPLLPPGFMPYVPDGMTAQGPEPIEHKGSLSDLTLTPKQLVCIHSKADERFFGGAKGVGKSLVCLADFAVLGAASTSRRGRSSDTRGRALCRIIGSCLRGAVFLTRVVAPRRSAPRVEDRACPDGDLYPAESRDPGLSMDPGLSLEDGTPSGAAERG